MDDVESRLRDEVAAEQARLAQLRAEHAGVVTASADSNSDDEHDPEGSTVGWERELLTSAIARVEARLAELDLARERLRTGTYGTCEVCGGLVGADRLAARPTATRCVRCASASR